MNVIIISGNVAKTPELKKWPNGISSTRMTVAVPRNYRSKSEADFIDVTAFDKRAEYIVQWAKKGSYAEVAGRLQSRKYTAQDGTERIAWEVIAYDVTIMTRDKEEPKEKKEKKEFSFDEDELPF